MQNFISGLGQSSACLTAMRIRRRKGLMLGGVGYFIGVVAMSCGVASAQRVLLFEDFESSTPDLPANAAVDSLDSFNRSEVLPMDPGTITVTGGNFPDPFPSNGGGSLAGDFDNDRDVDGADYTAWEAAFGGARSGSDFLDWQRNLGGAGGGGNKSMLFYNPNAAVQQAANWFSIFPADEADPHFFFKNGTIEFDMFLDPVPNTGLWTFFEIRLGFQLEGDDRGQVTTEGDQNIWTSFRMQEGGIQPGPGNYLYDQTNTESHSDNTVIVTGKPLHVRYEINGNNAVYSVFVDDLTNAAPEVEVINDAPWIEVFDFVTFMNKPAPGINEISFLTDASSRGVGSMSAGNAYLDNLRIVDNDQAPLGVSEATSGVPEPSALVLLIAALPAGLRMAVRRK